MFINVLRNKRENIEGKMIICIEISIKLNKKVVVMIVFKGYFREW